MKFQVKLFSAFVIAVGVIASASQAQVVPFKASGTNSVYDPFTALTTATGKATHMGRITGTGAAIPTATSDPLVLEWTANGFEFTAANGDQMFFEGSGFVYLMPLGGDQFSAVWTADFYVTGGTGRFSNASSASQPISVTAVNDPFTYPPSPGDIWTYDWEMAGQICLGRR